nr:phage holin family protein [Herbiconiux sp. L3-i23]
MLGDVSKDLSTLVRQEIELAKAETKETAVRAGKGAGLLGGAGYAALMALLFVSIALWWGLGHLIDNGWSAVVVAAVWGAAALVLYTIGRTQLKKVKGLPQTIDSVKRIPQSVAHRDDVETLREAARETADRG